MFPCSNQLTFSLRLRLIIVCIIVTYIRVVLKRLTLDVVKSIVNFEFVWNKGLRPQKEEIPVTVYSLVLPANVSTAGAELDSKHYLCRSRRDDGWQFRFPARPGPGRSGSGRYGFGRPYLLHLTQLAEDD